MADTDLKTPIQPRRVEFAIASTQQVGNDGQRSLVSTASRGERSFDEGATPSSRASLQARREQESAAAASASLSWRGTVPAQDAKNSSALDWSIEGTPSTAGTRSWHRNWGGYGRFQRQRPSPLDGGLGAGRTPGRTVGRAPPNESWLDSAPLPGRVRADTASPAPSMARGLFTPAAPNALDSSHTPPLQEGELSRWVTVFGFAPGQQSQVLREMRSIGPVLEHRLCKGNWMHVRYENSLQAQAACSRSSRLLNDATMIGIVPCTEPELVGHMHRQRELSGETLLLGESFGATPASAAAAKRRPPAHSFLTGTERSSADTFDVFDRAKLVTPLEPRRSLLGRIIDAILNW